MFHPTASFNYIFNNQRARNVFFFFVLGGVVSGINRFMKRDALEDPYNYAHFGIAVIFGAALGWISYYLAAYFLSIAGDILKGKATDRDFKTVIAWSLVPTIISLFVVIPQFFIYGAGSNSFDFDTYFPSENLLLSAFILIKAILFLWSIFILVKGIAYIQQFSVLKAMINLFVPFLLLAGILLAFIALISVVA